MVLKISVFFESAILKFLLLHSHENNTDRKNVTDFLYLVLHLACKVTCYFLLFSLVLVSVLRTSIDVLSKSKSKNYVTCIANLTKLFLSVQCRLQDKSGKLFFYCAAYGAEILFSLVLT